MNNFSVRPPQTIFDWVALREEFRAKLELLEMRTLSLLYGLSSTVGFRDDDFVGLTKDYLTSSADPIRARFDFAYDLGSTFWDYYEDWEFENRQPEKPGFVGDMVDGFHEDLLAWLLDGLAAYSNDHEVMDNAYFLVSRIGNFDTFLEEADIPLMESAARKEISLETSPGGRQLMETFQKFYEEQFGDSDKKGARQSDDDNSGSSSPPKDFMPPLRGSDM